MNVELASLWLPIVGSAVLVFIASAIVWMVLPHHRSDYKAPRDEEALRAAIRAQGAAGGLYCVPSMIGPDGKSACKDPAFQSRMKEGPWATFVLATKPPNMGKSLGMWFVFLLIVSAFVAAIASSTMPAGAEFSRVFLTVGATAFMTYGLGVVPQMIWKWIPASVVAKEVIDGLVYALLTAVLFAWLWPQAVAELPLAG